MLQALVAHMEIIGWFWHLPVQGVQTRSDKPEAVDSKAILLALEAHLEINRWFWYLTVQGEQKKSDKPEAVDSIAMLQAFKNISWV